MSINKAGVLCVLPVLSMLSGLSVADSIDTQNQHQPAVELKDNMWVAEGDILIASATDFRNSNNKSRPATQLRGLAISSELSLWPNGLVPFQVSDDLSAVAREVITTAIAHWNSESSIQLVDRSGNDALSEWAASSPDYLNFVVGSSCASYVGRIGGPQDVWISDYCAAGSVIHEIGHAVGLLHEHTRSDRDQYLSVQWDNIQSDKTFNFEVTSDTATDIRAYDYNSIMHYGEYYFSSNGLPTLVALDEEASLGMGQRVALSDGDLTAIQQLYDVDLSLTPSISLNDSAPEVTFTVTNLSENGASAVLLAMDNNAAVSGFVTQDAWSCSQTTETISCRLPVLEGQATSTITLSFENTSGLSSLNPVLSSKNFDTDLSNNSVNEPAVAAALSASGAGGSTGDDGASGNSVAPTITVGDVVGGAFDRFFGLALLLLACIRCGVGVVASGARFNESAQYAYSVTSASSSRARR